MTRRFPPPWRAEKFSGGYVVRDATGFAVAYVYGRSTEDEAVEAKQMTMDEARRVASNIAKLPEMLNRGERRTFGQIWKIRASRRRLKKVAGPPPLPSSTAVVAGLVAAEHMRR